MTNSGCKVVISKAAWPGVAAVALNCVGVNRPKPITLLCSMQFADSDFHTRPWRCGHSLLISRYSLGKISAAWWKPGVCLAIILCHWSVCPPRPPVHQQQIGHFTTGTGWCQLWVCIPLHHHYSNCRGVWIRLLIQLITSPAEKRTTIATFQLDHWALNIFLHE